ncbi:MAG: cell division protein FtsA, partial [Bacteroidales bacterium]|nr:cell division protein FtsA [Bacteroidales bacterium]
MGKSDIIVGLDIGTTKIAVVVGEENEQGKIDVLGFGNTESLGVKRGAVLNIEQTIDSIMKAIKKAEELSNVSIHDVNVGIAGQFIKSRQHRDSMRRDGNDDVIKAADITAFVQDVRKRLALCAGEEIISIIPQEYTIDNESGVIAPVGMLGTSIEANFHIITAQATAVGNINRCVTKSNLKLQSLILEPIASASAVLSKEEKDEGVVLVDIGGGTTDVAVFQNGLIRHTAVIPFGGEVITEDIKMGFGIIKKYAEDLKVKFGSALSNEKDVEEIVSIPGLRGRAPKEISVKNLSKIIQARMMEIIGLVHAEIKKSGYEKNMIAGIVLTGGGSLLKHAAQLTEYATGMETRIGYP